jgi:hypothetical protein
MWLMFFITFCFAVGSFAPVHEIDDWFGVKINNMMNGKAEGKEKEKENEKGNEKKKQTESVV